MEWIIWLAVIIMVGSTVTNVRTKSQIVRALEGKPQQVLDKMIEAPQPQHRLLRTWIVSSREMAIPPGWRWKCHCGVWGVADDASVKNGNFNLGSEDAAIEGFKNHAHQYNEVNVDFYRAKFEKEQADFAEYRSKCYCKETNDDLLKWKGL